MTCCKCKVAKRRIPRNSGLDPSQQSFEFLDGEIRLLKDMGERRSLDRSVRGYHEFQSMLRGVLLQANVAAALTNDHPAVALESPNDAFVVEARHLAHSAISMISRSRKAAKSSSVGSR